MPLSSPAVSLAAAWFALAACATPPPPARSGDADAAGKPAQQLELARLELRIAEHDAKGKTAAAEAEVAKAERAHALARREAESFGSLDVATQLEAAIIDRDRKAYAAEEARAELAELEAMYAAEEFAKSTKELVLQRGRRKLEIAQRDLENTRRRIELLEAHTLARKRAELEGKVQETEAALTKARHEQTKAALDGELAIGKARVKVEGLERKASP